MNIPNSVGFCVHDHLCLVLDELPRCKQRGINRNIYNRPKGRGIKPLSASGGLNR
jgi:hypothetical protein